MEKMIDWKRGHGSCLAPFGAEKNRLLDMRERADTIQNEWNWMRRDATLGQRALQDCDDWRASLRGVVCQKPANKNILHTTPLFVATWQKWLPSVN
jgi:hypothetical protein